MRITAAVAWETGQPLRLEEVDLDEPRDDEILVRIEAAGSCHTDQRARDREVPIRLPMILGHEGSGVVERVGTAVTAIGPGDKVLLTPDYCGRCPQCLSGRTPYCDDNVALTFGGRRADGSPRAHRGDTEVPAMFFGQSSFATHSLATQRNAMKVPAEADLTLLAALGCGIQTGAGAILNAMPVAAGGSVAVFGAGAVGLSAVMAAVASGAGQVIVIDRVAARLALAAELGATHTIDTSAGSDVAAEIRDHTGGGCEVAFDSTGVPELIATAVESTATRGVCGFVAGAGRQLTVPMMSLLYKGRSLRGIMGGDGRADLLLARLIALHERGRFPFERLIRHYRFEEVNTAMADSASGATIKPVLLMGR
ncbi:MAG TPA: NAD(P)-dependent alcohol dehydrogenase [Amycolatopsis sp.]|nr:NAD(P)-dependent alcohol dehydrogenase [Amycolatopsis sp.]